jgi:hypothetical protein
MSDPRNQQHDRQHLDGTLHGSHEEQPVALDLARNVDRVTGANDGKSAEVAGLREIDQVKGLRVLLAFDQL